MGRVVGRLLVLALSAAALGQPYRAHQRWQNPAIRISPVDFNGDSLDDLLVVCDRGNVQPMDIGLRPVAGSRFFDYGVLRSESEAGGFCDGSLWVTGRINDTAFVFRLWPFQRIPVVSGEDIAPPTGWDGVANAELLDLDGDGRLEVVAIVAVGFDLQPRGVFVLDWETGEEKWRFLTGPNVVSLLARDIDGDGRIELLSSTNSPGNGAYASGMADTLSYIFLLDADGGLRWMRQVGRYSSDLKMAWLNRSDSTDFRVLVYEQGNPVYERLADSIFVIDARDGGILVREQHGAYNRQVAVIPDEQGRACVLLAGTDDTLRLLDDSLRVIRQRKVPGGFQQILSTQTVLRLPGSGREVVPTVTSTGSLKLFDSRLRLLAEVDVGFIKDMAPVRVSDGDMLLVRVMLPGAYRYELYEFLPVGFWHRSVPVGWLVGLVGLAAALLVGLAYWTGYRRARDIRAVIRGLSGQAGVVELDRQGRVLRSNARAREVFPELAGHSLPPDATLAGLVRAATRDLPGAEPREVLLAAGRQLLCRATRVRSGVLLTLEDLTAEEFARQVRRWLPVAQELAHGIKNPLTTVTLTAQRLAKTVPDERSRKYAGAIEREAERLRRMTDNFMRFTRFDPPALKPTDLNRLVRDRLRGFEGADSIRVRLELAGDLPAVAGDEEQLDAVISNLAGNAVAAMPGGGELAVTTRPVRDEAGRRWVELEVADTGCGIPAGYLDRVFEPYFTLQEGGTGLGMVIVKRTVEDHGGSIRLESEESRGTTVFVRLPAPA